MIHITIRQRGQKLQPRRCHADATLFTCPFCTADVCKPRQYHQIMAHVAGHKLRAVEYGDQVIYSCSLGCDKKPKHFHCCQCPKTYINKANLKGHLCSAHPMATCAPLPQPAGQPLHEPHFQQPTPQSPPECPSQQPSSHPQELDSQQPSSHPPVIERKQTSIQQPQKHITIRQRGEKLQPQRCHADATLFTCPFCTADVCKPRQYHQIMAHIAGHKLRAVEYGDQVIYSCNLGCGEKPKHFHCCQCPKTYINKGEIKRHLCSAHPMATCAPQPAGQPLHEPHFQQPTPQSPPECPSQQQLSHPQELDSQQPLSHPQELDSQQPSSHPQELDSQQPSSHPQELDSQQPSSHPQELDSQQPSSHPQELDSQQPSSHPQELDSQQPSSHPQELDSQQPSSHPQELDSQQPSSHPQELDSQQPSSHPQELDSQQPSSHPPVIERMQTSVQRLHKHITIRQRGQKLQPRRCHADATLFTCPFCTADVCKPRQYHQIMAHIAGHKLRAVEYGDHVIYSCNVGCGEKARHFHCCACPKTYINKGELKNHLRCAHPIDPCSPEPVVSPLQEPSSQVPAPHIAAEPVLVKRKQISVQCPHCGVNLNSKNLKKHIERKHHAVTHPLTSNLPAQCVDKKNGIYVVLKSFCEPCFLIHVAKRFWGSSHKVMCDMDVCNSRVEMAQRNELLVRQCEHLSAVDYCCAVAPWEELSEDVLTEMEEQNWLEDVMKKQCLVLKNQAKNEEATFASLVTIGEPDYMYYLSIYEPEVSHYSKLGRVLVDYNAMTNTWCCPCSEGEQSCLHKAIAKWCLFQMKRQLFENLPETEEEVEPEQHQDQSIPK